MPPCKNSAVTGFPAPLADYIEVDSCGFPTFSYPTQVGRLLGELSHIDHLMNDVMRVRGPERERALKRLADEIRECREKHDTIASQWNEALQIRIAARAAEGG
jgi:aminoglycoside phosphotransferase (APT) family kinase protein